MEEMKGISYAINTLGNTIAQLEQELYYERLCRENAENRAKDLAKENERLKNKLEAVESYINEVDNEWQ